MNAPLVNLIFTLCVTVVCGALLLVDIGISRGDAQETVRLLRHGDKVDVRLSEMRGTQPWAVAVSANVVRPDLFAAADKGGVI